MFETTMIDKFKVNPTGSLFEADFREIKNGLCPICYNKLKKMMLKSLHFCPNKNHRKFIVRSEKVAPVKAL